MAETKVRSPCIDVCFLDENDICVGCYRTAKEITDWVLYSEEEKRAVVAQLDARSGFNNNRLR
jgi:hypothetical protein